MSLKKFDISLSFPSFKKNLKNNEKHCGLIQKLTLRESCPYSEIFLSVFSRIRTEYISSVKQGNLAQFFACDFLIYKKDTRKAKKVLPILTNIAKTPFHTKK